MLLPNIRVLKEAVLGDVATSLHAFANELNSQKIIVHPSKNAASANEKKKRQTFNDP